MDPGLTEIDLSRMTGRPLEYFGDPFVYEALLQAGDLFEIATRRTEMPDVTTLAGRTAKRGVLAMAEALYEGNKARDLRFSPFKSETIGSYTYSLAEANVYAGIPTGISWFDLAVSQLTIDLGTGVTNSAISAFDRPGDVVEMNGRGVLIGPADKEDFVQGPAYIERSQPL